jgi:hypothetical protein
MGILERQIKNLVPEFRRDLKVMVSRREPSLADRIGGLQLKFSEQIETIRLVAKIDRNYSISQMLNHCEAEIAALAQKTIKTLES